MQPFTVLKAGYKLRTMRSSDLDLVVKNENQASESPWSKRVFIDCLRAGYQCWVLASKDQVIGHGVMSIAIGESHLLTLCISTDYQGLGYGTYILRFLMEKASQQGARECFLEVRESNQRARHIYQKLGFVPIGARENYYPGESSRENAIIMSRKLPDS